MMKKLWVLIILALFTAACSSSPEAAESSGGEPAGNMGSVPAAGPIEVETDYDQYVSGGQPLPDTGTVITPAAPGSPEDPAAPASLSQWVGGALYNQHQERVSVVRELTLDLTSGQVDYVLVESVNGAAGGGAWQVLPWSAAQVRPDPGNAGAPAFYARVSDEALSSAPSVNPDQLNGLRAGEWEPQVLEYWADYVNDLPAAEPNPLTQEASEPASGFILASALSSMTVRRADGTFNLGIVQDVLVDPESGRLRYLLLVPSVDMGIGQRVIPVPLRFAQLNSEGTLDLPFSVEMLQNAPTVDQTEIPGITTRQWDELVEAWWAAVSP